MPTTHSYNLDSSVYVSKYSFMDELDDIEFQEVDEAEPVSNPFAPNNKPLSEDEFIKIAEMEEQLGFNYTELDENTPDEFLRQLRKAGLRKPPKVKWSQWLAILGLNPIHHQAIRLWVSGMKQTDIAEALGMNQARLSIILNSDVSREVYDQLMEETYGDARAAMRSQSLQMVRQLNEILADPNTKASTKVDIIKYKLDQSIGKAQQTVEHKGSVLGDLMAKIDQLQNDRYATPVLPSEPDATDNLISELLPDTMVVGQRKVSDEGKV